MFTLDLICMQYLCVLVIHQSLTSLYDLLMHVYTQVFGCIYSVRLSGCLFFWGGGVGAPLFFLFRRALGPPL